VDGIAATNFVVQEDHGLVMDAAASERFMSLVMLPFTELESSLQALTATDCLASVEIPPAKAVLISASHAHGHASAMLSV